VAQLAVQDTNASLALAAHAAQISGAAWTNIAKSLVSEWLDGGLLSPATKLFTNPEQGKRRGLIDLLLAHTDNEAAHQALTDAATQLGRQPAPWAGGSFVPDSSETNDLPWRLVAQLALQDDNASQALVANAVYGRIPSAAWDGIAETLVSQSLKGGVLSTVSAADPLTKVEEESRFNLVDLLVKVTRYTEEAHQSLVKADGQLEGELAPHRQ
jgi:hypothetical protein